MTWLTVTCVGDEGVVYMVDVGVAWLTVAHVDEGFVCLVWLG